MDDEDGWPPRAGGDGSKPVRPCRLTVLHATGVLGAPGHARRALLVDPAGLEPASSACEADALPLDDRPMVAGEGIAPPCLAYEARLDLSPANPQ